MAFTKHVPKRKVKSANDVSDEVFINILYFLTIDEIKRARLG